MSTQFNNLSQFINQIQRMIGGSRSGNISQSGDPSQTMLSNSPTLFRGGPQGLEARMSLSSLFQNDSLMMNPKQLSAFLRNTLDLPKEIRTVLMMLALKGSDVPMNDQMKKTLNQLLQENLNNLKVPVEDIQSLLQQNAKDATDKLMKLLQNNQMLQMGGGHQIMDMVSVMSKLSDKVKTSPHQAMESMMLLYIPWYPLHAQQKLELSFEMGEDGGQEGEKDVSVVLYLETNTLGRFKIAVRELEPLRINVTVFHQAAGKDVIPFLKEGLKEFLAREGLPDALFEAETIPEQDLEKVIPGAEPEAGLLSQDDPEKDTATAGFKKATRQADRKEITINPGEHLSVLVLNVAYHLARLIFEADEDNSLLQKNA